MTEIQEDNICVAVRIRPLNDRERKLNAVPILTIDTNNSQKLWIDAKPEPKPFIFDNLIDSSIGQEEIFELVGKPQAQFCLKGYNASIFAYGQTGAGKTFTMLGKTGEARGLQPRVLEYIFEELQKFESSRVKCSYLEIYNEQIIDLLSVSGTTLLVREDTKKGVYIEGLSEERVTNAEQAIELLNTGARNRHVSSTQMNFESSRSHSLFSLTIETKDREESGEIEKIKCSKFHFVDLAGSERQNLTGAAGQTLKEASNINKSLTVLGCVINSLVEQSQGKTRHIPYRDSKLTFILKDSLGGNSKTCIISAVTDASISFQETLSTLKFAQRAKMIKNKAKLNEENMITDVRILRLEIKQLKEKVDQMREHEALLERTVREARAAMNNDSRHSVDHSEELEILRQQIELVNAECERTELEFASGIQMLNAQYRSEVSKFENAFAELDKDLQSQFKSDLMKQTLHITPEQNKFKGAHVTAFEGSGQAMMSENQTEKLMKAIQQEIVQTPAAANRMNESEEDRMEEETQPRQQSVFTTDSFYLKSLNHLLSKINDSVQSRQQLQQSLMRIGNPHEWNNSEKSRFGGDESIQNLRNEYANQLQQLQQQLHESRENRQQLTRDLHRSQSALTAAQSELAAKESEMKSMESMYMEICSTMHEETEQKSTKRIVELEERVIQLTEEASLLKKEHARLTEFLNQSEKERSSLENDYQVLNETLEARESRHAILESEMNVQAERIKELEARELNSQQRILTLSNELETFITSSAEMLEEANRFERIELTNETLTASNEALTAFNEKLSSEVTKLNDQIEVLTSSNTYLQTRIDDLMSSTGIHEKIRFENMELNKKCAKLSEQYESLQSDLQNLRVNSSENSEALVEQNKALYRRIDEYVAEIDTLVKESNILKQNSTRKQEQITKLQQKVNEVTQSQKHFQAAHKDVSEKLAQAQQRITSMKEKAKTTKENDKSVTDLEAMITAKDDEIRHISGMLEERTTRCNEVCMRLNELLDDKDRMKDMQIEKEAQIKVSEAQNRLIETTSIMQKEKIQLLQRLQKAEGERDELTLKHKGLEETFNNLIVQYSLLKTEHNAMVVNKQTLPNALIMPAIANKKLESEVQQKNEKINDLQGYIDKYALQIRHLDAENSKTIKELDNQRKNMLTQQAIITESEKRIDDLVEVIGEFEMQCGAASNLIENLTQEHEDNVSQLAQMRDTAMAAAAIGQTRQTTTTTMTTTSGPSVQIINPKDYELLRLRDAKLTRKLKKYKMKLILMAKSQKHHKGHESGETLLLKQQLHDKEKASKKYQEMGDELSGKLQQANKKIAQQMEHIQFQLKCYEEDKKHTRIEAERTIKSLQTQLDEKTKLLASKEMRMKYFENLHGQITDSLDKNHQVYTQNLEVIKEKERRISYAQKLQCEIHNQLQAVINRKAFFKSSDESLRLALLRILDFIEHRSLEPVIENQPHNKENQDTANRSRRDMLLPPPSASSLATAGLLKQLDGSAASANNDRLIGSKHHHQSSYQNLNINSKMIAKDLEDLDRKLEQEYKNQNTSQNPFVLSPILEKDTVAPVCTLFGNLPAPSTKSSKHHHKKHHGQKLLVNKGPTAATITSSHGMLFPPDLKSGSSKLTQQPLQQFETARKYQQDDDDEENNHTKTLHRYLDESIANIFAETNLRRSNDDGDLLRKKIKS